MSEHRIQCIAHTIIDPSKAPVIIGYTRTPYGTFLGSLKPYTAIDLAAISVRGVIARSKINPNDIDGLIFGNVMNAGLGQSPAKQITVKVLRLK